MILRHTSDRLRFALQVIILAMFAGGDLSARAQTPPPDKPVAQLPRIVANQSQPGVMAMGLSRDGRLLATINGGETAKLWDVVSGRLIRAFYSAPGQRLYRVALSPDGTRLTTGTQNGGIYEWNTQDGSEITVAPKTGGGYLHWIQWSPDGNVRALGELVQRGNVRSFAIASVDVAAHNANPSGSDHTRKQQLTAIGVTSARFLPDGRHLAISVQGMGWHRDLVIWDTTAGTVAKTFAIGGEHLAISSEGVIATSSSDKKVDLFTSAGLALRSTEPIKEHLAHLFFSHDGKTIYGLDRSDALTGWDVDSGRRTFTIAAPAGTPPLQGAMLPLSDGRHVLAAADSTIYVRDLETGAVVRSIGQRVDRVFSLTPLPDPRQVLVGGFATLAAWDVTAGRHVRKFDTVEDSLAAIHATADGKTLLLGYSRRLMRLVDGSTGREIARITDTQKPLTQQEQEDDSLRSFWLQSKEIASRSFSFAMSANGLKIAHGRNDGLIRIFDTSATTSGETPRLVGVLDNAHGRSETGSSEGVTALAFSPDGRFLASGGSDRKVRLWEAVGAKPVRQFAGHDWIVWSLVFTPDNRHLITGSGDRSIKQWSIDTGELVHTLGIDEGIGAHKGEVKSLAVSPDGKLLVSGGSEGIVRTWDLTTGKARHQLDGHVGSVTAVGVSRDGKRVFSGGDDATLRVWDSDSGKALATFIAAENGEWLAMTSDGFFSASREGSDLLTVVRGLGVTTIDQVHQSLYNPDLVREALTGDVTGEVKEAAEVINLSKVLDSGPAPEVVLKSPSTAESTVDTDNVTATVEITASETGIGRVEWRVNGITAAVVNPGPSDRRISISQPLALDAGDNRIEVIAYNGRNLLASAPARTTVNVTAKAQVAKPRLHVLAIGIDAYKDRSFGPLTLAIKDAKALAEAFRMGKGQLYTDVRAEVLTDHEASRDNLDQAVAKFAEGIDRRDTFVFFAAAHGYAHKNKFYLIPADYQGGVDPASLETRAISQDRLQDWFSNRLRARKALVLLDTCESGALVAGHRQSRTDAAAAEATVGRLHEATGRPVLAAAAQGQFAHEGVTGGKSTQGIFTWAILDALRRGDRNGNGTIELSEIVAHVQDEVPKLAAKLGGLARSAAVAEPVYGEQNARIGSRGEDFALVAKLP